MVSFRRFQQSVATLTRIAYAIAAASQISKARSPQKCTSWFHGIAGMEVLFSLSPIVMMPLERVEAYCMNAQIVDDLVHSDVALTGTSETNCSETPPLSLPMNCNWFCYHALTLVLLGCKQDPPTFFPACPRKLVLFPTLLRNQNVVGVVV